MIRLLTLLLACAGPSSGPAGSDDDDDDGDGGTDGGADGGIADGGAGDGGDPAWPDPRLQASAPVLDPTLEGAPGVDLVVDIPDQAAPCRLEVEVVHGGGAWVALAPQDLAPGASATLRWDGRDGSGDPFPVGPVTVYGWTDCEDGSRGSGTTPLHVTRLGPRAVDLEAAEAGAEVALAFHKADLLTVAPQPVAEPEYRLRAWSDAAPSLAPWTDPDLAPWGEGDPDAVDRNVPAGLLAGSRPRLVLSPEPVAGEVTVVLTGPVEAMWTEGAAVELPALPASAGVQALAVIWTWAACVGQGCAPVPVAGQRTTTFTVYRLLGPSQLRDGSADGYADGTPWIGVLADTAAAVEGAPDAPALMDALRDRVYTDPWLVYDPGDSAYSDYDGTYIYWDSITSQLSDWLDRSQGTHLYCHSVSCLLSGLGQSWGADAEQIVLGVGFDTNLARAAGTETWGRWSFNSHSVATLDGGAHIWDASIDLDGDEDPDVQPVDAVSPKGMDGEEYLWRLTYDEIGIVNQGKCFVE